MLLFVVLVALSTMSKYVAFGNTNIETSTYYDPKVETTPSNLSGVTRRSITGDRCRARQRVKIDRRAKDIILEDSIFGSELSASYLRDDLSLPGTLPVPIPREFSTDKGAL
ncbi:hypothetical protein CDAR_168481 [Caerostris darwini]|uniref:Uncharacterized protein n=1 Tax=Caerostris darwini TaxID=1538125 RepID=A0AAV4T478_9ARAC|nr:hypothetical protein CDAR_168481 [Caerostris darwini]